MSDLKQFGGRPTRASEYLMRALTSGLARTEGQHPDGSARIAWMPGFVPVEYLRAENRARLGVTALDPVLDTCAALGRPARAVQA